MSSTDAPINLDDATPPPAARRGRQVAAFAMDTVCWAYLLAAIAAWAVLRFAGETWWWATLLALGPRWVLALPLAVLLPLALIVRRRSLGVLMAAVIVVVGPVMDLCLPWRRLLPSSSAAASGAGTLRVLTCNVHDLNFRRQAMVDLIGAARPDVLAFEEFNGWTELPATAGRFEPAVAGWHALSDFEVRVESRYPIRKVSDVLSNRGWSEGAATRYEVATPAGPVPLIVAHLASPHGVIRTALTRRAGGAGAAVRDNAATREDQANEVGDAARAAGPMVVCVGDMNLPGDAAAFRDGFAGLTDAFATGGLGFGWTYRVRWTTTRIDHVLTGPGWRCRRCWVGPDVGSPHRPVIAELERTAGP